MIDPAVEILSLRAKLADVHGDLEDMIMARNEQMFLADHLASRVKTLESVLRAMLAQRCSGGLITEAHWAAVREAVKGEGK